MCFRRVHISEKTLSFLNGEFEVEPGYGERREEALKMASIKTFFIIKTIKPVIKLLFTHIFHPVVDLFFYFIFFSTVVCLFLSLQFKMDVQNGSLTDQNSASKESVVSISIFCLWTVLSLLNLCVTYLPTILLCVCTQCATPIDDADIIAQAKEDSENFKKRLRKDLMNRDGHR